MCVCRAQSPMSIVATSTNQDRNRLSWSMADTCTHLVPGSIVNSPSPFLREYSTPFLTTAKTPCSTSKVSVWRRWMCLLMYNTLGVSYHSKGD